MVETRRSVCALDCPDACALLINVEDGRGSRLRGDPKHPVTRGFLCGKVAQYLEREYSPNRLLYPQKRSGAKGSGSFTRISWEEALDTIAGRLTSLAREYGPEAVLPYSYGGSMGLLNGSGMDRRFFHRFGASRLDRTICATAGGAALTETLGLRYGTEPEQFAKSKLIIAWGANVMGTNVHLWPFIVEARRKGARFYTIDPNRNRTGHLSDKHFFIHPGSDAALAFAIAHVIIEERLYDATYVSSHTSGFEELRQTAAKFPPQAVAALTGIAADEIVQLAREYATTRPAAIRLGYGVQRSERGGLSVKAISVLPALTGSWKEVGGGAALTVSHAFQLNRTALERPDLQQLSRLGREARLVNMSTLGSVLEQLSDPPVRALVVYNSNPAAIVPNQKTIHRALRRDELFTVVLEQFQTDTANFADILLPATTFLEHTDLYYSYGHYHLQMARPALPAPGEAKSNVEVFRLLARRMGFTEPCFDDSDDEMIRQVLDSPHPFLEGITLERLDQERSMRLQVSEPGTPFLPFAAGGFGTADGKCDLAAAAREYVPPVESRMGADFSPARYPLEMISPKNDDSMNSTFGYREDRDRETATLTLHPRDAAPRAIATGDRVRVFNDRGSVLLAARVAEDVMTGVVCVPAVRWPGNSPEGLNTNALVSERLTDLGAGPTFYNTLVQVERAGD